MLDLYAGIGFFAVSTALACALLLIRVRSETLVIGRDFDRGYAAIICLVAISVAALFYYQSFIKPLIVLSVILMAFVARRSSIIPLWAAVITTLLPLIVVKVTMLPVLTMVGLSFLTFRGVDVLINSDPRERIDWLHYVAYLFFPLTILAGPMYRWRVFQEGMSGGYRKLNLDNLLSGFETMLLGISQKFLLASAIDRYLLANIDAHDFSSKGVVLNATVFTAYLYFDFAGYSNMAVGIGKMLGLTLPRNFNYPILASNPQNFWRRWHISLTEWLTDVVFMPVTMKLCRISWFASHKLWAQNIGIFLTLLVMGIWNGLSLHYIVSGILFGLYAVVFNIMVSYSQANAALAWLMKNRYSRFVGRTLTLACETFAIYVFSGRSMIP